MSKSIIKDIIQYKKNMCKSKIDISEIQKSNKKSQGNLIILQKYYKELQ
jgi:hypothetical protein